MAAHCGCHFYSRFQTMRHFCLLLVLASVTVGCGNEAAKNMGSGSEETYPPIEDFSSLGLLGVGYAAESENWKGVGKAATEAEFTDATAALESAEASGDVAEKKAAVVAAAKKLTELGASGSEEELKAAYQELTSALAAFN